MGLLHSILKPTGGYKYRHHKDQMCIEAIHYTAEIIIYYLIYCLLFLIFCSFPLSILFVVLPPTVFIIYLRLSSNNSTPSSLSNCTVPNCTICEYVKKAQL